MAKLSELISAENDKNVLLIIYYLLYYFVFMFFCKTTSRDVSLFMYFYPFIMN